MQTVIVTGASPGIGAGLVKAFLAQRYNGVAKSPHINQITDGQLRTAALREGGVGPA